MYCITFQPDWRWSRLLRAAKHWTVCCTQPAARFEQKNVITYFLIDYIFMWQSIMPLSAVKSEGLNTAVYWQMLIHGFNCWHTFVDLFCYLIIYPTRWTSWCVCGACWTGWVFWMNCPSDWKWWSLTGTGCAEIGFIYHAETQILLLLSATEMNLFRTV